MLNRVRVTLPNNVQGAGVGVRVGVLVGVGVDGPGDETIAANALPRLFRSPFGSVNAP